MLLNTKEKFRKTFLSTLIVSSLSIPTLAVAADITLAPIDKTQETGEPVGYEPTDKTRLLPTMLRLISQQIRTNMTKLVLKALLSVVIEH